MNKGKRILSLCDSTGIWSQPYRDAGYEVIQVDLDHGKDVRLFEYTEKAHGVIAQPPCTHFAGSGARWWEGKGEEALLEGLSIVDACMRVIALSRPEWWVLENPVGRLKNYLGPAVFKFQPHEFAMLANDPAEEAYTKKTCLWGNFVPPCPLFIGQDPGVFPEKGSKMHLLPPSPERVALRSETPTGFAKAFFEVNP